MDGATRPKCEDMQITVTKSERAINQEYWNELLLA